MGIFTIDYGDKGPLIVDAFCDAYHYQDTIPGPEGEPGSTIPNPETRADFTKRHLLGYIRAIVKQYLVNQAVPTARSTAQATADTETADITVE